MKTNYVKTLLVLTLLIVPNLAMAAPVINSLNGSVLRGQDLTITGQGFGNKTKTSPLVWDNFSLGNNGDALSMRNGWIMSSDNPVGDKPQLSNSLVRYPEAPFSAKFHFPRNYYAQDLVYKENLPVSGTKRYFDYWMWYKMPNQSSVAPDSLQHQLKLFKLQSGTGDTTDVNGYPVLNTYAWRYSAGNRETYSDISADTTHNYANGNYWSSNFIDGAWNHVRTMVSMGTEGNKDGILKVWLNEKQVLDTTVNFVGVGLSGQPFFNNIQIGKYLGNTNLATTETTIYYGEVYYDDSWNKVEICDSADYTASSHCEIQPYKNWSDVSTTISLNQGSFTNRQAYLYITDADGNVNANGYPLTFGSNNTVDTQAPAAPSGLVVQ